MQLLFVALIVLLVYLFIRLLANFGTWMGGDRYRAYRHLAAHYHGRYESRGLSEAPTVSFTHNAATVRVGLAPTIAGQPAQIPRTRVVARFQPAEFRSGWSWRRLSGPHRLSPPRALGLSSSATKSSTAGSSSRQTISR